MKLQSVPGTTRKRRVVSETGSSIVEYALAIALIAIVSIRGLTLVGKETKREFNCIAIELERPGVRDHVSAKLSADPDSLTNLEKRYVAACDLS